MFIEYKNNQLINLDNFDGIKIVKGSESDKNEGCYYVVAIKITTEITTHACGSVGSVGYVSSNGITHFMLGKFDKRIDTGNFCYVYDKKNNKVSANKLYERIHDAWINGIKTIQIDNDLI